MAGFRPKTASISARSKPDDFSIREPCSSCRLWPITGGVVLGIPKGQLRRLRLGLPHRRPDHTDQRGELRSVGGRDALMQVLRQFQDHGL